MNRIIKHLDIVCKEPDIWCEAFWKNIYVDQK